MISVDKMYCSRLKAVIDNYAVQLKFDFANMDH